MRREGARRVERRAGSLGVCAGAHAARIASRRRADRSHAVRNGALARWRASLFGSAPGHRVSEAHDVAGDGHLRVRIAAVTTSTGLLSTRTSGANERSSLLVGICASYERSGLRTNGARLICSEEAALTALRGALGRCWHALCGGETARCG